MGAMTALAEEAPEVTGTTGGDVALMQIRGPLSQRRTEHMCGWVDGYDGIAADFANALSRPDVSALVVAIDSPGGDVAGLEECCRRIVEARTEYNKPVAVYVDELAASAAYRLAVAFAPDDITIPQSGRVGSIGCIGAYVDETEKLKAEGVAVHVVRFPEGKAATAPAAPLHALAQERLGADVRNAAETFFGAVGAARDLEVGDVAALDGAVLAGGNAVRLGLADHIGSLESVAARMRITGTNMKIEKDRAAAADEGLTAKVEFAARVLHVSGQEDPAPALRQIEAWKAEASKVEALTKANEELSAQVNAAAEGERDALCARLVTEGGKSPSEVWANPIDAATEGERKPKGYLANMAITDLREMTKDAVSAATLAKVEAPKAEADPEAEAASVVDEGAKAALAMGFSLENYNARRAHYSKGTVK